MRYVGGARESGCIFCNRLAGTDDVQSLIVHRDSDVFVIMNLYPYNSAHLMIVPNAHVGSPENVSDAASARLGTLLGPVLRALRRVLRCEGFNVGINVGDVAGAGVAEHLHQHVVPRWTGDANFMPILAGSTVMPELLPVTYAKVRAEIQRELTPAAQPGRDTVRVVLTTDSGETMLHSTPSGPRLPRFTATEGNPLWRAALDGIAPFATEPEIVGWSGEVVAALDQPVILAVRACTVAAAVPLPAIVVDRAEAVRSVTDSCDRAALARGFDSIG